MPNSPAPVFAWGFVLALLLPFSLLGVSVTDASPHMSRLWQSSDGLPQDDVHAICQTPDGYLCVGTQQGLALFDGLRFTAVEPPVAPEPKRHVRTLLCADKREGFWSATDDGKLRLWQRGIAREIVLPAVTTNSSITALCASDDGSLWIGTDHSGLLRLKADRFTFYNTRHGLAHRSVRSVYEDEQETIWVATAAGVNKINGEKITKLTMQDGLPHNSIRVVFHDKEGNLWVASNYGLTRWKDGAGTHFTKEDGLTDNLVTTIFQDHTSTIWAGTLNGLNRFVDGKWLTETRSDGSSYDRVNCIFEDREQNLWIGTRDGLSRLNPRTIAPLGQQQGLTHNTGTFVFSDAAKNVWVGFWGGGVNKIESGKVISYTTQDGLSSDLVLTMHQTRQGDLWFGMDYDGGLTLLRKGKFIHYGVRNGLKDQGVKVIHEDITGNLWIGTRTALISFNNGKFTRYTTTNGLPADTIEAIHEDRSGRLWFGTTGGLALRENDTFTAFTTTNGLSHNSITSIYEDAQGNLWLGTRGGGINKLTFPATAGETNTWNEVNSSTVHITAVTAAHGLYSDHIVSILEDDFGFLWMGSPRGIFRVSKIERDAYANGKNGQVNCISFGKADGMISIECKGSGKTSACKGDDGRLWFATAKGIAIVDPKTVVVNELPPPVVIEEILADKKTVEDREPGPAHSRGNEHPSPLTIPAGRGELEFRYTALSLRQPEKNFFKYKLEGVDTDWVDAQTRRVAYYNNIKPGSYRFHVLACNNDGVWNQTGATYAFILLPHFWETLWFKSSIGAGFILLVAGGYRLRISRLKEIERLRLRIAADLHDEVGSSIGSISVLSEMLKDFGDMGAEEKKDVTKINQLSMQTAGSIREIVWFINPDYDTLHELLLRMKDVAGNLLVGITHRFDLPSENLSRKLPLELRQNFFLIFKEVLANVMKHSHASCVQIRLSDRDGHLELQIEDNGIGFDSKCPGTGNGLKNLRRRTDKLKATLEIRSQPGQGTLVRLSVPLTL